MYWILLQQTDWLTGYFHTNRVCYSKRFEEVHNTLITIEQAHVLPSNIIILKAKVLSPNSWYKHVACVLENC